MDLEDYEGALDALKKAQMAQSMYGRKVEQIQQRRYISEEESDAVIDSLLQHEDQLARNLDDAARTALEDLKAKLEYYQEEIRITENLITEWTGSVYPNFRSESSTYTGPDGRRSNRSPVPVPVPLLPYKGSKSSLVLDECIRKLEQILNN